ncbi:Txe/YoeB family addiction module toxin [Spirosoma litoris]
MRRHPFEGIGKPEPLKGNLSGWWSRRITDEHRLIYKIDQNGDILISSVKGHYGDK